VIESDVFVGLALEWACNVSHHIKLPFWEIATDNHPDVKEPLGMMDIGYQVSLRDWSTTVTASRGILPFQTFGKETVKGRG
jgi:hypothetical protein